MVNNKNQTSNTHQTEPVLHVRHRSVEFGLLTAVFLISAFAAFLFVRAELRSSEMNQDPNVIFIEPTPEAARTATS